MINCQGECECHCAPVSLLKALDMLSQNQNKVITHIQEINAQHLKIKGQGKYEYKNEKIQWAFSLSSVMICVVFKLYFSKEYF